jgi:hypothetical protein
MVWEMRYNVGRFERLNVIRMDSVAMAVVFYLQCIEQVVALEVLRRTERSSGRHGGVERSSGRHGEG